MNEVLEVLKREFQTIHTGRASTSLVEGVKVMSYGQPSPLKAVAHITVPEPNQIAITPWDKDQLSAIETAIRDANLGLNPVNDGHAIRVTIPPLTEERRKELTKQLQRMAEDARIALRDARRDAQESTRKDVESNQATEDDKFAVTKELDALIADYNGRIEEALKAKEAEVLKV